MPRYHFLTTWLIEAARQDCWELLADAARWPEWWPAVDAVREIAPGDARRVGSVHRVRWRAPLAYSVELEFRVDQVREPALMSGCSSGELEGRGTWRLFEQDGVTAVVYEWDVHTTRVWMNALAPLARPLFSHSHDRVMRGGGEALAGRLGARLLGTS